MEATSVNLNQIILKYSCDEVISYLINVTVILINFSIEYPLLVEREFLESTIVRLNWKGLNNKCDYHINCEVELNIMKYNCDDLIKLGYILIN